MGEIILGGAIIASGFALEVVTIGGFTFGLGVTTTTGLGLMGLGATTMSLIMLNIFHAKKEVRLLAQIQKQKDIHTPLLKGLASKVSIQRIMEMVLGNSTEE